MGFYALIAGWLGLLLPVLAALYFLKLKRPQLEVPSLVLWRRVLDDQRVNSPFQRFKRNLLLLVQLLLLAALVLAAMQPYFRGGPDQAENLPVLIDCSASMAALDRPRGGSRLDEARARVRQLIDGLLPNQKLCLISFADAPRKLTPFTDDRRLLHDALDRLGVDETGADLAEALRMVQALARSVEVRRAVLYSDGNVEAQTDVDLSFQLDYQRLSTGAANVGITTLNARHAGQGQWDVYATVESSLPTPLDATLELLQDGRSVQSQALTVARDDPRRLSLKLVSPNASTLELRLRPVGFDALSSDNSAHLMVNPGRALFVRLARSLESFRGPLRGMKGVLLSQDEKETGHDLVVTDDEADLARQAPVTLLVGKTPKSLEGLIRVESESADTAVVDWQRSAELLRFAELGDLTLLDSPSFVGDAGESSLEARGWESIAHGRAGPLILRKRDGDRLTYAMLFHPDRSTLIYRLAFPIVVSNLVNLAMERSGLAEVKGLRTGVLPAWPLRTPVPDSVRINGPGGLVHELRPDEQGLLTGVPAPLAGVYEARAGQELLGRLGVGLLRPHETSLASVEKLGFRENIAVAASTTRLRVDRSIWSWLALAALGLLAFEWWMYQRRPRASVAA